MARAHRSAADQPGNRPILRGALAGAAAGQLLGNEPRQLPRATARRARVQFEIVDSLTWATWVASVAAAGTLGTGAYALRRQSKRERRTDAEHGLEDARRVHVSVIDESLLAAQVDNDSHGSIYEVGVCIVDKNSEHIFAQTAKLRRLMKSGEKRRFSLMLPPGCCAIPGPTIS
jgi:hypothetical protein